MRRQIPPKLRQFARDMRKDPTDAEAAMWDMLRGKRLGGMRFRRQHPIKGYIVDFVCLDSKLIIEVDGGQHAENDYDDKRDKALEGLDFTILRFWNDEVLENSTMIASTILDAAGKPRM